MLLSRWSVTSQVRSPTVTPKAHRVQARTPRPSVLASQRTVRLLSENRNGSYPKKPGRSDAALQTPEHPTPVRPEGCNRLVTPRSRQLSLLTPRRAPELWGARRGLFTSCLLPEDSDVIQDTRLSGQLPSRVFRHQQISHFNKTSNPFPVTHSYAPSPVHGTQKNSLTLT